MNFPSYYISGQSGWTNMDNMFHNGQFGSHVQADPVYSQQAQPCANPFGGQLACSSGRMTYPPSGASDLLQQATDLSVMNMISPPRNPYGNYGMFSPVTPSVSPAYSQVQQAQSCANPIACSSGRMTSPQGNASDLLQQATDLSMMHMTSPPSNPYSNYGMFSPVTPSVSPAYPGYLSNLRRNPMFQDLQMLLNQECYGVQVPANLITTSWNLMQLPSMDSSSGVIGSSQEVYVRHVQLQDKLLKVRINPYISADGLKVENEYSTTVGQIEMGRYQALTSNMGNTGLIAAVNSYYDKERLILVQKVEADLDKLIAKVDEIQKSIARANVMQKESIQGRPLRRNAVKTDRRVQHHSFGSLDDADEKDLFEYGFKSDVDVDAEVILNNDKEKDKNCVQMISMSQSCGQKQNNMAFTLDDDGKCAENTNFIQPDSTVNLSPVKPVSDKSCLINNGTLTMPNQRGSPQAVFLDSSLSLQKNQCGSPQAVFQDSGLSLQQNQRGSPQAVFLDSGLSLQQNQRGSPQAVFLDSSLSLQQNQCKSTVICTPEKRNNHSVELSPSNDQSDFLLRIACGSTGKSKNGRFISQSQAQSQIPSFHPELQALYSSQQNSNLDKPTDTTLDKSTDTTSGIDHCKDHTNLSSDLPSGLPYLKTHNDLSNDAANILRELQYPTKEELAGVKRRRVKKRTANKPSRFSTLSTTEDCHQINFNFDGKGKKRKHLEVEKDD